MVRLTAWTFSLLIVGIVLHGTICCAHAQRLVDEVFSLNPPVGLKAVAREEVQKQNALLYAHLGEAANPQSLPREKPSYKYGFALPNDREAPFESPYMLVDVHSDAQLRTAATVMNAEFKTELAEALTRVMGAAPILLHESSSPIDEPYMLEYKVWDRRAGYWGIHAFSMAYTTSGYVMTYWFTRATDYGLYVDKLRAAVQSLEVAPALRRPGVPVSPEFLPEEPRQPVLPPAQGGNAGIKTKGR